MLAQTWEHYGFGFILALILALWAVFHIAQSERASPLSKAIWVALVLFIPFLGFLAWLLLGPRAKKTG